MLLPQYLLDFDEKYTVESYFHTFDGIRADVEEKGRPLDLQTNGGHSTPDHPSNCV